MVVIVVIILVVSSGLVVSCSFCFALGKGGRMFNDGSESRPKQNIFIYE